MAATPHADAATHTASAAPVPNRHRWWTLTVLALSVALIVIDGTIVNVAMPAIIAGLSLSFSATQWVGTLYALIFASLLLTTGRLGDRIGRRTTLLIGVVLFVAASALAGLAGSASTFLAARAIQGVGAAFVLPSTLSVVNATFFGRDRTIAFAVWGSTISATAAIGPLLGGALTTYANWRWIFWINLPIGLAILAGILAFVPQTRGAQAHGVDIAGLLLSVLGFGGLVFGLVQGATYGWWHPKRDLDLGLFTWPQSWSLAITPPALAVGLASLIAFIVVERSRARQGKPALLDLGLFRFRSFAWGNLAAMVIALGEFGLLFVLPLYMQNVLSMSAMKAGWVLAAMAIGAFFAGGGASGLSRAWSAARTAQLGLALEAIGVAGLALTVGPQTSLWALIAWLVCYGFGLGLCSAQLTSVVLADVPPELSGQGSATQSTVRQVGSALGVAIMSTLLGQQLTQRVTGSLADVGLPGQMAAQLEHATIDSAGGVMQAIHRGQMPLPMNANARVFDLLADQFSKSTAVTMAVAAAALALAFIVTLRLPNVKPAPRHKDAPKDDAPSIDTDERARTTVHDTPAASTAPETGAQR